MFIASAVEPMLLRQFSRLSGRADLALVDDEDRVCDDDDRRQDRELAKLYRRQAALDAQHDMLDDGLAGVAIDELELEELLNEFDPDQLLAEEVSDTPVVDPPITNPFLKELIRSFWSGADAVDDSDGVGAACTCDACPACLTAEAQAEYAANE